MSDTFARLAATIEGRKPANGGDPATSYVSKLFAKGDDAILKKVGEEAVEAVMAAKDGDKDKIIYETADLWFHSLIMLSHYGITVDQVMAELDRRTGVSGLEEKAARKE